MVFLKRNYLYFIFITFLLIILAYTTNITNIPESLILFQSQDLNLQTIAGVKLEETLTTGATLENNRKINYINNETININNIQNSKIKQYNLSLLGFNIKTIKANIIPKTKVIPLGNLVGLKLYTQGVLVVGMNEIQGEDKKVYKPYENAGISEGDAIIEINKEKVNTTEELISCVSKCKGKDIEIKYIKNGKTLETTITPVKTSKNTYKIGLWVRDSTAGVGTATFYEKSTNSFATLGHGIQDIDTEELVNISSGEFVTTDILKVEKGEENKPGKIEGTIENGKNIGKIYKNTEYGIYGITNNKEKLNISQIEEVEVAARNEIKQGKANIICSLENNIRKEYEVEIEKVYINNNQNNKSMIVKVTDKELLEKTGGIIQGMSGSPILQNGKLIGALTHVFVSNPAKRIWSIRR